MLLCYNRIIFSWTHLCLLPACPRTHPTHLAEEILVISVMPTLLLSPLQHHQCVGGHGTQSRILLLIVYGAKNFQLFY